MELWIRSQDKKYLENVKRIEIFYNEFDGDYYIQTSHTTLGSYETGERAIEILNEIQNLLKGEVDEKHTNKFDIYNADNIKVYEMPNE